MECGVAHRLDHHPTHPERNDLSEAQIRQRTNDQLDATGCHLLYQNAIDPGVGSISFGPGEERVVSDLDFALFDIEHHTAGFGLMKDIGGSDLHRNRETDLSGKLRSFASR